MYRSRTRFLSLRTLLSLDVSYPTVEYLAEPALAPNAVDVALEAAEFLAKLKLKPPARLRQYHKPAIAPPATITPTKNNKAAMPSAECLLESDSESLEPEFGSSEVPPEYRDPHANLDVIWNM